MIKKTTTSTYIATSADNRIACLLTRETGSRVWHMRLGFEPVPLNHSTPLLSHAEITAADIADLRDVLEAALYDCNV